MTLKDVIHEQAEKCVEAAETSLQVGDPFWIDQFKPMLEAVANCALNDAQLAIANINVK